ncbi:Zeaxanthin epoxidase, chloroplastic [Apostasia shenzhenica]|uniref:Zeaxanthin epoxidase, chloroplastic n=1 Tax=Apostasia shenzhenica TaxID=1088818 RepID=A0A2H9ZUE0_9ASPA|nr:Zeaxanthin epoxidase, chloroplastic [Apostasia shenzhenica]
MGLQAVIGCDGVHSVVAQWLGLAAPRGTGRSAIRGLGFFPDGHGYEMAIQQFISTGDLAPDFPPEFKEVVRRSDLSTLSWVTLHFRSPWSVLVCPARRGCVTVAGDAFHPMTPDLGQGGGIALEDAVVLARCLARAGSARETEEGMAQYVAARRWRAAAVIMASFFSGFVQQASGGPLTRLVKLI